MDERVLQNKIPDSKTMTIQCSVFQTHTDLADKT